jgi:hypothetical protein
MTPRPWATNRTEEFLRGAGRMAVRVVLGALAVIAALHGVLWLFGW